MSQFCYLLLDYLYPLPHPPSPPYILFTRTTSLPPSLPPVLKACTLNTPAPATTRWSSNPCLREVSPALTIEPLFLENPLTWSWKGSLSDILPPSNSSRVQSWTRLTWVGSRYAGFWCTHSTDLQQYKFAKYTVEPFTNL